MKDLQKMGGVAALIHAAAYVVGIALGVTLIFPVLDSDPGQYMAFVADNQPLMHIWILGCYWIAAVALVVMALALYERLKAGSPALVQTATVFGFIWAGLIIGSANLMLYDFGVIADLYGKDPAQAGTIWLTIDSVLGGLAGSNEVIGGIWVLLVSWSALRTRELPRVLNYLGVVVGVAGLISIVPALDIFIYIFALGQIVWFIWLGIAMLRSNPGKTA